MNRLALTFAVALLLPCVARAEIAPTFSDGRCETAATHVVVVDNTGKVLESWRGDLKPGDVLPLKEFHIPLAGKVGRFGKKEGVPEKVSGKRLVLFLIRGMPIYDRGQAVGSWAPANWMGDFNVSTLWIEDGHAFGLEQWINPGPQELSHAGTEADVKKAVEKVNKIVHELLAKARNEKNLAQRAKILASIAKTYPGFSPEAFAGLEWCEAGAVPALRSILKTDLIGDPVIFGVYSTMAKIGAPARDDLMRILAGELGWWKQLSQKVEWANKLDLDESRSYRLLLLVTSNPDAFANLTAAQVKTIRELRDLWANHPVLSKLGEKEDRIHDRLDRVLLKYPR
ncbi:MAG: hypothetical protein L0241_31630 [Planctomycetia bacterium]|nr:hypothetical protein [Planctomycetia bacterium]